MGSDWGYKTPTHTRGTVTGTNGTVVAAKATRKYLYIKNELGGPVYLAFGAVATTTSGAIRLSGSGTADCDYEMSTGKGNVYTGNVQAIVASGTAYLDIVEGV